MTKRALKTKSKILILHGNLQGLADLSRVLAEHFSDIFQASRIEDVVPHQTFDLILVDYSVSDMTGILLYKKINQSAQHSLTPSIFIAETKSYDHRLHAFEMGAADLINHPFENKDVIRKCQLHLKNRR